MYKGHLAMKKILRLLLPELFFTFLLMVLSIMIIIVSLRYGFGALRRPGPGTGVFPAHAGMTGIKSLDLLLFFCL